MTNLQMAQLSTTMSQAHRATAFHFFTSNLNQMIKQWGKFFYAHVTIILQYLFLSFPATTPEPLGCSESLSTSILQLGFIQSLKVQAYHFMISTYVSQLKSFSTNQAQRLCPSLPIAWYYNMIALVYNCVDKVSVFEKYLWLAGQPGLFDTGMCAVPGNSHPASVVFVQFWKRGTGLSLSCESD